MSRVFVCGFGVVSPAGWGVPALRHALDKGGPLPTQALARPGWDKPLAVRNVPEPVPRPAFMAHPRLRRTSPITQYAAAATLEALAGLKPAETKPPAKLGLVMCLHTGCIQHSYRFFDETLRDPATASPLVFPETVCAAPGSHVAALLGTVSLASTLVGDPATFLQGLALGASWLLENRVDLCLVIGAEEVNWLLADVVWHFDHQAVLSGGAGAVCLTRNADAAAGVALERVTGVHTYTALQSRAQAARQMRRELPDGNADQLLVDGLQNRSGTDAPERAAWRDWTGPRLSPKAVLGEGLMAGAAWQCVAACDAVATRRSPAALVSIVGCNQQAIGARLVAV